LNRIPHCGHRGRRERVRANQGYGVRLISNAPVRGGFPFP
jgi:hypothetical protein